ncbi:MAG: single-stranded-DNA-specific exonuclease RecJ [Deltaproteobacteria bacterium]|nr:single-stranded-DNA-specific exonuclease RecJ [Deltaproteobacteria bacterium]TLN04529.1 MAG: single-stranded-DNA-specific exonuclease RecJ [bacterium]
MQPVRDRRWNIAKIDENQVLRLARESSLPQLLCRILLNRGVDTASDARRFLSSSLAEMRDPFLLKDMDKAVERLCRALLAGEKICVYGDYDVDGVTSVASLVAFLSALDGNCFYYIPKRMEEGYGLNAGGIREVAARGARIIITADCGITAHEEANLSAALGIDLIITDHHTPPPEIPRAYAVINPLRSDCAFPFKSLAGVGVVFNLLLALRKQLREAGYFSSRKEPNLREFLDLVALGTIADIVPLVDENRILVRHGLKELSLSSRAGVSALKAVAGVSGEVDCGMVGFRLAPRINAAGRLDDAALGVELLLTNDARRAAEVSAELNTSNEDRQHLEKVILEDALQRLASDPSYLGRTSIVMASESWHAGVIGIVASRLVDLFHRPTILVALQGGVGKGSGRSIPGFHLYDALQACSDQLLGFGGHKYAAGLSLNAETFTDFAESFDRHAAGLLTEEDLLPELRIDAEILPEEVTLEAAKLISTLEPFGMGNPRPLFVMRGVQALESRILKDCHLKTRFRRGGYCFDAIGFDMADRIPASDFVDIVFSLDLNSWNGRTSVQLRLKDLKVATK